MAGGDDSDQRIVVQKRLLSVLGFRCAMTGEFSGRPLSARQANALQFQSLVAARFARLRTTVRYEPAINETILGELRATLQPGMSCSSGRAQIDGDAVPGFGRMPRFTLEPARIAGARLEERPHVEKHWLAIPEQGGCFGQVIEAISPRAVISPLEKCSSRITWRCCARTLARRIARLLWPRPLPLGQPYDFEFDFNVTRGLFARS